MFKNRVATFSKSQEVSMDSAYEYLEEKVREYSAVSGVAYESDFEVMLRAVIWYANYLDDRIQAIRKGDRQA